MHLNPYGRDAVLLAAELANDPPSGRVELVDRCRDAGLVVDATADDDLERTHDLLERWVRIVDALGTWRERTGASRVYLQVLDLADLDAIELVASEVAPQLG